MTAETTVPGHDALVAPLVKGLCTRTLNQFAQESRADGESLKDAVERYEVDYAWHILCSDRILSETISALETQLSTPVTETQRALVSGVLKSAAEAQAADSLMSFDNEVPALLAQLLCTSWREQQQGQPAEVVS